MLAEKLLNSLRNGNREAVTLNVNGNEKQVFIEADPQRKSIGIYDKDLKKISLADALDKKQEMQVVKAVALNGHVAQEQSPRNGVHVGI